MAEDGSGGVTIREVAARAGVALSSVSRVLSGHPDVSPRMRERVEAAAAELGYEPDFRGQSLRSGRTQTIGFLLRDIANPAFALVARQCEHELRQAGYLMLITSSDGDPEVEARNLDLLRRRHVDGVIASLVTETGPATVTALSRYRAPVVLLDREVEGLDAGAVLTDHYPGVREAVAALVGSGHRRIALVTGEEGVRSTRERRRALTDGLAAAGLEPAPELLVFGSFDRAFAQDRVAALLRLPDPPTAILAGGVGPSAGALAAIAAGGSTASVVALDEWPDFDVTAPGLASVTRDFPATGAAVARLLLDMLDGAPARVDSLPTSYRAG